MLQKLTKAEETERYLDFAYRLALEPAHSGYPTYADGVKTRQDFIRQTERALREENQGILLFEKEGRAAGWIQYYCIPEDHYFSASSFLTKTGTAQALKEFLAFGTEYYPDCDVWLGFPAENREAVEYLESHSFQQLEHSQHEMLFFEEYAPLPETGDIRKVTEENFSEFRQLHDPIAEEMYWNSDRLFEALDRWEIYLFYENGRAEAAIYWMDETLMLEIFGMDFRNGLFREELFRGLLVKCLNEGKNSGAKALCYFMEEREKQLAAPLGFRHIGEYRCFRKEMERRKL